VGKFLSMEKAPRRTSTLDKYRKRPQNKSETETAPKNEIRVTKRRPGVNGYVFYAANLLLKENEDSVIIKAAGNALARGVLVAEIIRHRVPGLHQINAITRTEIVDEWEPLEEGLDVVKNVKFLPVFQAKLTKTPTQQEKADPSYQEPLPINQIQEIDLNRIKERPPRGENEEGERKPRGRGGRGFRGSRGGQRGTRRGTRGGARRDNYGGGRDNYGGDREREHYGGGRDNYGGGKGRDNYGSGRDNYSGGRDNYGGGRDNYGGDREREHYGGRDNYGGGRERDNYGSRGGNYRRDYDEEEPRQRSFRGGRYRGNRGGGRGSRGGRGRGGER